MCTISPKVIYSTSSFNGDESSITKLKNKIKQDRSFLQSDHQTSTTFFSKGFDTKSIVLQSPTIAIKRISLKKSNSQLDISHNVKKRKKYSEEDAISKKLVGNNISIKKLNQRKYFFDNIPNIKVLPYKTDKMTPLKNAMNKIDSSISKLSFIKKVYDCVYSKIILGRIRSTSKKQKSNQSTLLKNYITSNNNLSNRSHSNNQSMKNSLEMSVIHPEGNRIYKLPFLHKERRLSHLTKNKQDKLLHNKSTHCYSSTNITNNSTFITKIK